ncbi:MAG: hypothetical protein ACFFDI_23650 [Promethearchaeota archaeon]
MNEKEKLFSRIGFICICFISVLGFLGVGIFLIVRGALGDYKHSLAWGIVLTILGLWPIWLTIFQYTIAFLIMRGRRRSVRPKKKKQKNESEESH